MAGAWQMRGQGVLASRPTGAPVRDGRRWATGAIDLRVNLDRPGARLTSFLCLLPISAGEAMSRSSTMEKAGVSSSSASAESAKISNKTDGKTTTGFGGFLRVFKYGEPIDYALEAVGILAAIASGVALAMMNLIIGGMMNLMSDFSSITADPDKFMAKVSKNALYFVYIGIARFATTYVYSALFTYVAFKLTRNVRRTYLQAALSQEISFFDHGTAGSIAMQATTNGKLIQSGIAEKLGLFFSSISTFVAAFIIAFVSQ
ncbi:uncharacterized protein CLUP02_11787 [Colletotrichum lupini]|uniref:ABC transmembrane type-1 domain-containing protein n=1 Tax=Colletotrichum lupini TaxID=145971 RepID=A0A9Q8WKM4_9PEZI|nr:uncharacterized protein CLUP02_11787 [Colletotrichum lupini]UQC86287.1 hypothetical protein CLUP02_11787 [Colletotrichum lupini]